jgi:sarcosine oxidase/L-pipecolate oxidase
MPCLELSIWQTFNFLDFGNMVSSDSRIIIIGGGAWGLSTALYLTEAGYSDVTILDRAEAILSPYSAAYDLNKIVRAEYEGDFYSKLALVCHHFINGI